MKMNPQVNENFEDEDLDIYYDDDELDVDDSVRDRMLNTIEEMMEEGDDDRTDMSFDDFIIAANLLRKTDRVPGNAQYLHTLDHVQVLSVEVGRTLKFYAVKENIHGHWVVSDDTINTNGVIGYLVGAAKVDMKEFYVEFAA